MPENEDTTRRAYLTARFEELKAAIENSDGAAGTAVIQKMRDDGYADAANVLTRFLIEIARDAGYDVSDLIDDEPEPEMPTLSVRVYVVDGTEGRLSQMLSGAMDWRKCGKPGCEVCGHWPPLGEDSEGRTPHEPGA